VLPFGEGRAAGSNVSTVPAAWCQARLRAGEASDGTRVDRMWPRGLTNEYASVEVWLKDIVPSAGLRT